MNASLVTPTAIAVLLTLAVLMAWTRLVLQQWRVDPAQRSRPWRIALLLLAQPLCAGLLYLALWPPTVPGEAGTLVVATAGATSAQLDNEAGGDALVALPESAPLQDAERVPDLGTALRRHPGTRRVRVVGAGLETRDRDAAHGVTLEFVPAALPHGLVQLAEPERVVAGNAFTVGGRAEGLTGGHAELLDPGNQRVARVALPKDGRFVLTGIARVAGAATFTVRLRDAKQRIVEDVELPLQVETAEPTRVLLLAGAPGPEVKYLRRWASDAGLPLHTQMSVGGGVQLGDAPIALNAGNLARFDVAVLDERAWSSLGDAQRAALNDAVRNGLGLLIRVTAALSEHERRRLRALGFDVDGGRDSAATRLASSVPDDDATRARLGPGTRDTPRAHDAAVDEVPELTRRAVRIQARDGVAIAAAQDGTALGQWRAYGSGRVGVWTLTDSYRLILAGRSDLHGELWSGTLSTLARAKSLAKADIDGEARQGQRLALCAIGADARVTTPGGATVALTRDPATGTRACAAFWPREAGWHRLQSGANSRLFFVRASGSAPGVHANEIREETMRLSLQSRDASSPRNDADAPRHPTSRWPWWLAWLLASGALWWLERARAGRRV